MARQIPPVLTTGTYTVVDDRTLTGVVMKYDDGSDTTLSVGSQNATDPTGWVVYLEGSGSPVGSSGPLVLQGLQIPVKKGQKIFTSGQCTLFFS